MRDYMATCRHRVTAHLLKITAMLFNSYSFIFFYLPVVLLGFFWLARVNHSFAAGWLALASLFFYGYWNPAYIGLLLGSIVCNYAFGLWISKAGFHPQGVGRAVPVAGATTATLRIQDSGNKKQEVRQTVNRKLLLIVAIAANLLLLAYYKCANFFAGNLNPLLGTDWNLNNIILPLGISFFTFTQIAFLVDTYQGKVKEYKFAHYVLFVTYFPHLIAGPVLHHKEMMPQFADRRTYSPSASNFAVGFTIFCIGLAKKVLLADNLAPFASSLFDAPESPSLLMAWGGILAY